MKIEIQIPKFYEFHKKEIMDMLKEAMDALGIWQYIIKEKFE